MARDRSGPNEQRDQLAAAEIAAAEAVSFDDLGGDALLAIQRAVGASNALLYRYDEPGRVRGVSGTLSSAIPTYAAELFPTDPVQHHLMRVNPKHAVVRLPELDPLTYRKSAAYNEFYHPHDVHHLLGFWLSSSLPYGTPGMTGILFTRAAGEPDFSPAELRALTHALPSFRAALRRADRIDRVERERRAIEGVVSAVAPGAYLALDRAGRLLWTSPEADALLAPLRGRGDAVPPSLRDAAAKIGAIVAGELPSAPPPFRVELEVARQRITAELRLGRSPTGEPVVAVTLTPRAVMLVEDAPPASSQTRPSFESIADRYKLTRAEQAVLACLGEGLSNREIARRLFVSVETVKTHVQRVLAKLDVASRTQAAVKVAAG